jgi:ParB-like chromosome segregation protein Spo0J
MLDAEANGSGSLRSLQIEAKIADWRLPFEFIEEYAVDSVTIDAEAQVRAGIHIAPRERVDEYAAQMRNGAKFPPIVVNERRALLDGNTRLAAARRVKRATLPTYVVTCGTPEMAVMLAAALNQMGGERLTAAEAAEAAQVMMARGFPDDVICRELGRDPTAVRRWKAQLETTERADRLGLDVKTLTKAALERLASVRREDPFKEAVALVRDAGIKKPADITALVDEINQATSDEAALHKIAERRDELAPAGPPPGRANVRKEVQVARMAIGSLLTVADADLTTLAPTLPDRERWLKLLDLVSRVVEAIGPEAQAA